MKKYSVISLTDHSGHSKENSIYSILREMSMHDKCKEVFVASRGLANNKQFFTEHQFDTIIANKVSQSFEYDPSGQQFSDDVSTVNLDDFDIIFLRLPRPVSDQFLSAIKARFENKIFINDPEGIIECSSKAFLINFPSLCPPIQLCKSIEEIIEFSKKHDIVLKPLREYGGKGLLKISGDTINDGKNDHSTEKYLKSIEHEITSEGYLAMKFLKNVNQGDKRLIVVNGEILASSLRLPPEGSWLCNVALGGKSVATEPTLEEKNIIETINPLLKEKGILIYGADTLVDDNNKRVLSEINTLSIGGFPQAQKQTGLPIIKITLNKIFDYAHERHTN